MTEKSEKWRQIFQVFGAEGVENTLCTCGPYSAPRMAGVYPYWGRPPRATEPPSWL